jgi:glutamate 5-kinase
MMCYHRIVVKFGTSLLTSGTEHLDLSVMANLAQQVAQLHHQGKEVIVVSSGAIAAGGQKLKGVQQRKNTPFKQVLASVGQSYLMRTYEQLFSQHNITIAQALLTKHDLSARAGYLNARNTLLALVELDIICIVNENDVVALDEIEELKFGDNDNLSAMVANLVDADLLVLLTDTGGLYTADPHYNPEAQLIRRVDKIDAEIERLASNTPEPFALCHSEGAKRPKNLAQDKLREGYRQGIGGMATKIEAAKLAISSGVSVIIADGREPDILARIDKGEDVGTLFPAQVNKMESKKRWMLSGLASKGSVVVDQGAALAVKKQNKSLLPAGVVKVDGDFQRGDIVNILDEKGEHIGCGISNYSSADMAVIKGAHSDRIIGLLGYDYGTETIHRNNMVIA